jgi:hypothetical protein
MEIVRDPNVISAYMKKREEIEFDKIPLDQMVPLATQRRTLFSTRSAYLPLYVPIMSA